MKGVVVLAMVGLVAAPVLEARPIRTRTPGTGIFIGSGFVGQVICDESSLGESSLTGCALIGDFRYTPATHWVLGVRAPLYVERKLSHEGRELSRSGLGDVEISGKHRFFRQVGPWFDRHAAIEVGVKLPSGESNGLDATLPAPLAHRLPPGTGSTDAYIDLIYQQGQRRFVWGGDLQYRWNGQGEGNYRFGEELRLAFDLEYIAFPRDYRTPGNEVFVLVEGALIHRSDDEVGSVSFATGGTEVVLAPGVQYIATEQMLVSLSLQLPVWSDLGAAGVESDWNLLAEFRLAF